MEKCEKCGAGRLDCDCGQCHKCHPEEVCETCGMCHLDHWESMACWSSVNDPDYDPFDI